MAGTEPGGLEERTGRGPWGLGFPMHIRGAIAPDHLSSLRSGILHAISLSPHTGRMASSKSFKYLADMGQHDRP